MSSCETSDAEGPLPVNSAAVLKKSRPAPGNSPCRGHVLRKAKVSALPARWGSRSAEGEQASWGGGDPSAAAGRRGALQRRVCWGWWGAEEPAWPPDSVVPLLYVRYCATSIFPVLF